jgi:hypothetical protein
MGDPQLKPDWFARNVAELSAPGVLDGPVQEKWRVEATSVIVRGDRAVIATRQRLVAATNVGQIQTKPANADEFFRKLLVAQESGTVHALECRELQSGRIVWRTECGRGSDARPGAPVWFDKYILLGFAQLAALSGERAKPISGSGPARAWPLSLPSTLRLIDAATGHVIREFAAPEVERPTTRPFRPTPPLGASPREFVKRAVLADDGLLTKTYLNPGGPSIAVPLDIAKWSHADADLVWRALRQPLIPRCGAVVGTLPTLASPGGDVFWHDGLRSLLCRTRLLGDGATVWETPFLNSQLGGTVWKPPLLIVFSGTAALVGYDLETGHPTWTYEWPDIQQETYTKAIASLTDSLLLLTNPQVPRPYTLRQFQGKYNITDPNTRSCLIKLDPQGKLLFRQELSVLLQYGGMAVGRNALVAWSGGGGGTDRIGEGPVVCFAPVGSEHHGIGARPEDSSKIHDLIGTYEKADVQGRLAICTDLARLGDTSIAGRVLADLEAAGTRLEAQVASGAVLPLIRPGERDRHRERLLQTADKERMFYVRALGVLKDPRTIAKLLPLIKFDYLRPEVRIAILAITDGEPLKDEAYRTWRDQRIAELHTQFDRERKYASERVKFAAQLRELDDPQILELLLRSLQEAAPNERDFYVREIGMLRNKRAIPALLDMLDKAEPMRRHEVQSALNACAGVPFAKPEAVRAWWQTHQHLYQRPSTQPQPPQ